VLVFGLVFNYNINMRRQRWYQYLVMFMFLAGACLATYHFRKVLKDATLLTHFYYIPIIIAALWWRVKGVLVAVFLGGQLVVIHLIYETYFPLTESYLRALMFVVMAFVVGILSERYTETREQVSGYEDELRSLASELSLAEEREKHRIAVELHDHFGQDLALLRLKLEEMKHASSGKEFSEELDRLSSRLKQTVKGLRSLTFDLSSSTLYELGFEKAVAEWLSARIKQEHGIATKFTSEGQWESLDENISVILFQTVRELLVNVVKHAQAGEVKVSIHKKPKEIRVTVQDDGIGFNPEEKDISARATGKLGLFSIRERMGYLGGRIEIESRRNRGSQVTLILPLNTDRNK